MTEKTKGIVIISIANGLIALGYGLSVPFFAIYLSVHKNVSSGVIGLVLSLAMLTTAVASAISGEVSDAFGRKRVMTLSLLLRSITMLAIGFTIYLDTYYLWPIALHFAGCFFGAFFRPSSNAWIADNTTPTERIKAFGYIRIGLNLGWTIGPAMGGFLAGTSFASGFFLTGCIFLLSVFYVHKNIKETLAKTERRKSNFVQMLLELKNGTLAKLCAYEFLISTVTAQLVVGLSLHCANRLHLNENVVGMLFAIQGLSVVILQYPVTRVTSKLRLTLALAIGCFLYAVGFGSIGFAYTFFALAVGVILSAIGEMCVLPAGHSLASNLAPDNKRGRYLGLYTLANQSGIALGIFGAGIMMQHISPVYAAGPWLIVGAAGFAAGMLFFGLKRHLTLTQDGLKPTQSVPIVKQFPS